MADFPSLDQLPSLLLEQIIAKLDWKSYFRLQQTCRQMEEFVRSNRKLYTRVDKNSNFKWTVNENGRHQLLLQFSTGTVNISSVYGIRLRVLAPPRHMETEFSTFCDVLKRHRISCSMLPLQTYSGGFELTKERCVELIKILKPEEIHMQNGPSNRFEALVHSGKLKRLFVHELSPSVICPIMENLVRHRNVELITGTASSSPEEIVTVLFSICQILRSLYKLPFNLHHFELCIHWNEYDSLYQQHFEEYFNRQSTRFKKAQKEACNMRYDIEMPGESVCNIIVGQGFSSVVYRQFSRAKRQY